jgi:hypothetical protein
MQIGAHAGEIRSPDSKLEEVHENEPELYILHIKFHFTSKTQVTNHYSLEEIDIQGNFHTAEVSALVESAETVLCLALAFEIVGE